MAFIWRFQFPVSPRISCPDQPPRRFISYHIEGSVIPRVYFSSFTWSILLIFPSSLSGKNATYIIFLLKPLLSCLVDPAQLGVSFQHQAERQRISSSSLSVRSSRFFLTALYFSQEFLHLLPIPITSVFWSPSTFFIQELSTLQIVDFLPNGSLINASSGTLQTDSPVASVKARQSV